MRTVLIAGNWKMNHTVTETEAFFDGFSAEKNNAELLICPPFIDLPAVRKALEHTFIRWGAQNVYPEDQGAFTGEISPAMLHDLGCTYCICGHSERRTLFGETDGDVNRKAKALLGKQIYPIVCVGETEEERRNGLAEERIASQLRQSLEGIGSADLARSVIAYEPIWAIGTGCAASAEDAHHMAAHIRRTVLGMGGEEGAASVRILYGGSVNPSNISSFLHHDIDGALVGGASLRPEELLALYEGTSK